MNFQTFHKKIIGTIFVITAAAAISATAQISKKPKPKVVVNEEKTYSVAAGSNIYCAGFVQTAPLSTANKIVGAENEQEKYAYATGNNLFVTLGANADAKAGDKFSVVRPRGQVKTRWSNKKNLGFYVQEVGTVEVVKVKPDVTVVRVSATCDNILIGDLLMPMQQRTSPAYQDRPALDRFAEPTGKASGRIFLARDSREMLGREEIVYIDLGADDNVQIGDHLTIYRPLGKGNLPIKDTDDEEIQARNENFQSEEFRGGTFSNQAGRKEGETATGKAMTTERAKKNRPKNLRKIVGEMVILNVKEKTATAVITRTAQEIHTGDMVEVQ